MDHKSYRDLIAGRGGGFGKCALRLLLRLVSYAYRAVVTLRNCAYDVRLLPSHGVEVPVISVGNITTGGTGKTPLVIWLCSLLAKKGVKTAVLTRGYKAERGNVGDEAAILAKACPQAKVIVDSDRFAGASKATGEHQAQALVMDDGFQHRRLKRDLDIVAIDATCPFGYGRLLPAGLLREPIHAIRRADAVVITRYDRITAISTERLVSRIEKIKPGITIAKAVHHHPYAKGTKGTVLSLDELRRKKIFAFCGIGNPDAFLQRLREYGMDVLGSTIYNDHHSYTESDIGEICAEAKEAGAEMILSTEKDWVKTALFAERIEGIDFAFLAVELQFIEGAERIERLIDGVLKV